jgi:hypothetical protein
MGEMATVTALHRDTWFVVAFVIGALLGLVLLVAGGVATTPPPPQCPHCAVVSPQVHPLPGCYPEAVVGGYICS